MKIPYIFGESGLNWGKINKIQFLKKMGLYYENAKETPLRWIEFIRWLRKMHTSLNIKDTNETNYYEFLKVDGSNGISRFSEDISGLLKSSTMNKYIQSQESDLQNHHKLNGDEFYKKAVFPFIKVICANKKILQYGDISELNKIARVASLPLELSIREDNHVPFHLIILNLDATSGEKPLTIGFATCVGIDPPAHDSENFASIVTFLMGIASFYSNAQLVNVAKNAEKASLSRQVRHSIMSAFDEIHGYLKACTGPPDDNIKFIFWMIRENIFNPNNNGDYYLSDLLLSEDDFKGMTQLDLLNLVTNAALLQGRRRYLRWRETDDAKDERYKGNIINICKQISHTLEATIVINNINKMLQFNIDEIKNSSFNWLTQRGFIYLYYDILWQAVYHGLVAITENETMMPALQIRCSSERSSEDEESIIIANRVHHNNPTGKAWTDIERLEKIAEKTTINNKQKYFVSKLPDNGNYFEVSIINKK